MTAEAVKDKEVQDEQQNTELNSCLKSGVSMNFNLSLEVDETISDLKDLTEFNTASQRIANVHAELLEGASASMTSHTEKMKDLMNNSKATRFMDAKAIALSQAKDAIDDTKELMTEAKAFIRKMKKKSNPTAASARCVKIEEAYACQS